MTSYKYKANKKRHSKCNQQTPTKVMRGQYQSRYDLLSQNNELKREKKVLRVRTVMNFLTKVPASHNFHTES